MQTSVNETLSQPRSRVSDRANPTALWTFVAAALLAAFYLATSISIAAHRLFWFDELFTVHIARLPGVTTIFTALGHGSDALPRFITWWSGCSTRCSAPAISRRVCPRRLP